MSKKERPRQPYKVGYGKPPTASQFKAGRSGNPRGRPKGADNLKSVIMRVLKEPVQIRSGGRTRKVSTQEAAVRKLREDAFQNPRILLRLLELAARFNNDPPAEQSSGAVDADEKAILDAYVAKHSRSHVNPSVATEALLTPDPDDPEGDA